MNTEAEEAAARSALDTGNASGTGQEMAAEDWRARQDRIIAEEQAKRVKVPMGPLIAAILIANGITVAILFFLGIIHR
jgi:hypothetical protein